MSAQERAPVYLQNEAEIRAILAECPGAEEIKSILALAELDISEFYKMYEISSRVNKDSAAFRDIGLIYLNFDFNRLTAAFYSDIVISCFYTRAYSPAPRNNSVFV